MSGEIKIPITGDARDFIRSTDDVEGALDDVADALDGMARDTKRSAQDAAQSVEKVGDAADKSATETKSGADRAERAVDDLADTFREAQKRAKALGDAGDDAGDEVKKGMKRAEEGVEEFKDEAQSTAKEAAASFDGSFESIGDIAQEVAANAFAGFGPAGTAAGIAVAAGAGVMIEAIGKVGEAFDEARESAFTMAYEVGGALESAGVQARMAEWSNDTEKWRQVTDLAVASGWDEIDVLTAMAKGGDDLDKLTGAFAEHGGQTMITNGRLLELDGVLRGVQDGYMSGAQAAEVSARALSEYAQQAGVATGETDDLGNAIYELPDRTQVVVDAETGQAYQNVDALEQKVTSVPDGHATVTVTADTSEVDRQIGRLSRTTVRIGARVLTADTPWE